MSNNQLMKAISYEVSGEKIELEPQTVKNYLVRGNGNVTDQEILMFMNLCQYQKLNPMINEAYLIKFGQQPAQIIVSKEAFMKRAEAHDEFEGFEAGIIYEIDGEIKEASGAIKPKNADLLGGWCKVYRGDRQRPIEVKVSFDEFGKGQATWKDMPMNMIRKTAIVNALREAFPNTLGAMYTEEETKKSAVDDIPEYKAKERKDITPNQEPINNTDAGQTQPNNDEQLKVDIKNKFKQLGITNAEGRGQFFDQNGISFKDPKNPTMAEMTGLIKLLDLHIEQQLSSSDELE